jgi:TonB family protein
MNDSWTRWEGHVVEGKFTLLRFLGGSERGGVFLVDKSAGGKPQTAVKLVPAASVDANDQLRQWKVAADLNHPNVIRVFESGRCELAGTDFLYVQTEYAEEDLAQILPQRALTDGETRQVLDAVLKGLAYIHGNGLVHGRVKPSNILAAGDVVKMSSDSLRAAGEVALRRGEKSVYDAPDTGTGPLGPSTDVWSLGVTLAEVLTQRLPILDSAQGRELTLPAGIPEPFHEIARGCVQVDPGSRWTLADIAARLEVGKREASSPPGLAGGRKAAETVLSAAGVQKKPGKWIYALALVAVIAAVLMVKHKTPGSTETRTGVSAPHSDSSTETRTGVSAPQQEAESGGDVVRRVMPSVSPGARRTITGTIRVLVKVDVDAAGNVSQARLQTAGPSQYFSRLALEAAREWKFKPLMSNGQAVASEWVVRFGFNRRGTESSVRRTTP